MGSCTTTHLGEVSALPGLTSEKRRGSSIPGVCVCSHLSSDKGKRDEEEREEKDQCQTFLLAPA